MRTAIGIGAPILGGAGSGPRRIRFRKKLGLASLSFRHAHVCACAFAHCGEGPDCQCAPHGVLLQTTKNPGGESRPGFDPNTRRGSTPLQKRDELACCCCERCLRHSFLVEFAAEITPGASRFKPYAVAVWLT